MPSSFCDIQCIAGFCFPNPQYLIEWQLHILPLTITCEPCTGHKVQRKPLYFFGIFVPAPTFVYARFEDFRPFQVYIFTSIIK